MYQKRLPEEVEKRLNLRLTDKTVLNSYIYGCVIYDFADGILVSNYDIIHEKPCEPGMWYVQKVGRVDGKKWYGWMYVTEEFFCNVEFSIVYQLLESSINPPKQSIAP